MFVVDGVCDGLVRKFWDSMLEMVHRSLRQSHPLTNEADPLIPDVKSSAQEQRSSIVDVSLGESGRLIALAVACTLASNSVRCRCVERRRLAPETVSDGQNIVASPGSYMYG